MSSQDQPGLCLLQCKNEKGMTACVFCEGRIVKVISQIHLYRQKDGSYSAHSCVIISGKTKPNLRSQSRRLAVSVSRQLFFYIHTNRCVHSDLVLDAMRTASTETHVQWPFSHWSTPVTQFNGRPHPVAPRIQRFHIEGSPQKLYISQPDVIR